MEGLKPTLFYQEFTEAVTAFFNDSPAETRRTIRDLLFSLRGVLDALAAHSGDWDEPRCRQCLDALGVLCGNLPSARQFSGLVARLGTLVGENDGEERGELLESLRSVLDFCCENIKREG